jgi:RNA polymerase sigma factor (sigma-70 family)
MSDDDPITQWIAELRDNNDDAAAKLWKHFVQRLSELARHRLSPGNRSVYDEDDVVVSAFNSLFTGIAAGQFPELDDRGSLWRLLLIITSRKVSHRQRHDLQQRRDVRRTLSDSVFTYSTGDSAQRGIQEVACREPTPEFVAQFTETSEALIECLGDVQLQDVAILRMEGYTDTEIAQRMKCSRSTVQRRLELVRRKWQRQIDAND